MATAQASMEPTLGFPPKGSLKRFPFPRLIREIASSKLSGSLYLLWGQTKKVVFFEQGQPVFVRSNVLSECLGQILAHEGLITQEQCEQTLEAIRRTGKKQGELLVEMGILSEGNLRYGLEAQLRAKLFDIFSWEDGRYQFKRDTPNLQFGVKLDSSAEGVIIDAIQDQYSETRARESLSAVLEKYPITRPDGAEQTAALSLLPEERHLLACLDGSRSVRDLLDSPPDPIAPSPGALLHGLWQSGLVTMADDAKPAKAAPSTPDMSVGDASDESLAPTFDTTNVVTEYEDTPLPGELPKAPGMLGDHEDDFAGIEDSGVHSRPELQAPTPAVSEELRAAEGGEIDETFDDSVLDAESQIELLSAEDLELEFDESGPQPVAEASPEPAPADAADAAQEEPASETPGEDAPLASAADAPTMAEPEAPPLVESMPGSPSVDLDSPTRPPTIPPPDGAPIGLTDDGSGPTTSDAPPPMLTDDPVPPEPVAPEPVSAEPEDDDDDIALDLEGFEADDDLMLDEAAAPAPAEPEPEPVAPGANGRDHGSAEEADPELDDIDLGDIDGDLALDDDLDGLDLGEVAGAERDAAPAAVAEHAGAGPHAAAPSNNDDDLMDFDDLDAVDLGDFDDLAMDGGAQPAEAPHESIEPVSLDPVDVEPVSVDPEPLDPDEDVEDLSESAEVVGARRFNDAETALSESRFDEAVSLLEEAYENGFDVAELHAMLAYARFQASNQDRATADHAFELLDYAQNMDPSLDLVHAYRGAILQATGQDDRARESLDRALELNPYCELAMEIMDSLG